MADLRQEKPGFVAWTSSLAFFISCGVCGFASMPTGFETYTFCLMIVSRGAVYHTRKSAGEWKHFHRGCDCKVAPSCVGNIDKTKAFEFALGFVRPRICWAITLAAAVFRFCRRLVSASAFGKLIDALEESTKVFCRVPPDVFSAVAH